MDISTSILIIVCNALIGRTLDTLELPITMWNRQVIPSRVIYFFTLHAYAIYGLFALERVHFATILLHGIYAVGSQISVTAGMHRLWTHESYEASMFFQGVLMYFATCAQELSIIDWVQFHRTHHKYADTSADPHNINDGFWFAHVGWLLTDSNNDYKKGVATIDFDDVLNRKDLQIQKQYYWLLVLLLSVVLPVGLCSIWNDAANCYWLYFIRTVYVLNATFLVNSAAHTWGAKPFDKSIESGENRIVSILTWGEGWHNYHHTYSKDYRASANILDFNITGLLITMMAKFNHVWNRKVAALHYHGMYKKVVNINKKDYKVL